MTATQPSPRRAQREATGPVRRLVIVHGPDGVGRSLVLDEAPVTLGRAGHGDGPLALADDQLSRQHARFEGCQVHDLGSTNGTFVDGQAVDQAPLADGTVLRVGQTLLLHEIIEARSQDRFEPPTAGLLGPSPAMQRVRGEIARVARHAVSVLIQGETGVGKERVAEAIHQASGRRGPFVPVNCAALPADLVESELFGHVAGAFSGARAAHDGLFVAASGGTLFLDEIGEMPLALQPKLLRALSTGSIRAVGATGARAVDVRVVAATHRDVLEAALGAGSFRADLYARLAGWVIHVPPLRTRRADVLPLARATLARLGAPPHLTADAAEALLLAPWPFNVRGLEQAMMAAAVRADGAPAVDVGHLDAALAGALGGRGTSEQAVAVPLALRVAADVPPDAAQLLEVLEYFEGNVADVARFFGKDRRQIYRWAERLGVDVDAARGRPMTLAAGHLVDDRFEIEGLLGQGGFGTVYRAHQLSTGQRVALKVMAPRAPDANTERARFEREMAVIARLNHPHIVRLLDFGALPDGRLFTVLEFIEGETLQARLARGALPATEALRLMGQVLDALDHAHRRGVVHRDLKPANIMVLPGGRRPHALVLDFGIAGLVEGTRGANYVSLTTREGVVGTPAYMAPEQLRGTLSPASDLYAWGLCALECLTGRPAVEAESPMAAMAAQLTDVPVPLPAGLARTPLGPVLARAVAKDPDRRFATAGDLADALEAAAAPPRPRRWPLAVAVVAAAAAGAGLAFWLAPPPPPPAPVVVAPAVAVEAPPQTPWLAGRLQAWRRAWERTAPQGDTTALAELYDAGFTADGRDREAFLAQKGRLGRRAAWINVDIVLEATRVEADRVEVDLRQTYRAPGYTDSGRKTLVWVEADGAWRIREERFTRETATGPAPD